jgi:hypothetical protein
LKPVKDVPLSLTGSALTGFTDVRTTTTMEVIIQDFIAAE